MKILQIIPAAGWMAQYEDEEEDFAEPLVCWALIEDYDEPRIVGMATDATSTDIVLAKEVKNFKGYIHESEMR